ncbi:MAG: DUF4363 family protein [Clostridia bacterium]|nr:DUF4363 family protein [Clostridia bacterium]
MKRVYAAAVILLIVIAVGIAERRMTINTANDMLALIESIDLNDSDIAVKCSDIRDRWHEGKNALLFFLPHSGLDDIDIAADKLAVYAETGDLNSAAVTLGELRGRIDSLAESELISLTNLF